MAAPKLTLQQQKQTIGNMTNKKGQKTKSKSILCTPFIAQWPEIDKEVQDKIISELVQLFSSVNLKRPVIDKKLKRNDRKAAIDTFYKALTTEELNLRKQLVCGVNEVTKKLERNEVELVLVNKSSNILTKHLIQLAGVRNCTAVQLYDLDKHVCHLLSLTQLSCLGFKKSKPKDHTTFKKFINFVKVSVPEIDLPWLSFEQCISEFVKNEAESDRSEESEEEELKSDNKKYNTGKSNLRKKPVVQKKPNLTNFLPKNKGILSDFEIPIESDDSEDIEELLKEDNNSKPLDFISFSNDNCIKKETVVNPEETTLKRKNINRADGKSERSKKSKKKRTHVSKTHEFFKPQYNTLDLNKIQPNVNRKTKKKKKT